MASLTTQWLHHWRGIVSMRVGRTRISMHFFNLVIQRLCRPTPDSPCERSTSRALSSGVIQVDRLPLDAGSAPALKRR